jgi:hypothetical protein
MPILSGKDENGSPTSSDKNKGSRKRVGRL